VVRGICSLRPGVPGLSENITVRSIVDRLLEHSRIYYFENACRPQVFVASADWLPRNCFRRIETAFPIDDGVLREQIISEILAVTLADNSKARFLQPDGSYRRAKPNPGEKPRRSQSEFIVLAAAADLPPVPAGGKTRHPQMKLAPAPPARRPSR